MALGLSGGFFAAAGSICQNRYANRLQCAQDGEEAERNRRFHHDIAHAGGYPEVPGSAILRGIVGDRTPIGLFLEGIRLWEPETRMLLLSNREIGRQFLGRSMAGMHPIGPGPRGLRLQLQLNDEHRRIGYGGGIRSTK